MKILFVTHAFPPEGIGGTERYAEQAAHALAKRGHQVRVFSGSIEWRETFATEAALQEGLPVLRVHRSDLYFDHWDKIYNPHVTQAYLDLLHDWQPDVIHLHHWIRLSSDLTRQAAALKIPTAIHLHDLFSTCPRVFRVRREDDTCADAMGKDLCRDCAPRWSFQSDAEIDHSVEFYQREIQAEIRQAAHLLAPSASHARFLEQQNRLPESSIEVLPHPQMLPADFQPSASAESPAGQLKLLFFAHVHPIKGLHILLQAMHQLEPKNSVELDVFGAFATDAYEARIRAAAADLCVRFHGAYQVQQPAACCVDAIVIPTVARESYSFWLDEALAMGHPIVATELGALPERAAGRALFVPPKQPERLAAQLQRLRDDVELRRRLRQTAPAAVPCDLNQHIDALEQTLAKVADVRVDVRSEVPPPGPMMFEWDRREIGFQQLLRSEGWEAVLAQQNAEIEKLRKDLTDAEKKSQGPIR